MMISYNIGYIFMEINSSTWFICFLFHSLLYIYKLWTRIYLQCNKIYIRKLDWTSLNGKYYLVQFIGLKYIWIIIQINGKLNNNQHKEENKSVSTIRSFQSSNYLCIVRPSLKLWKQTKVVSTWTCPLVLSSLSWVATTPFLSIFTKINVI